MWSLRRCGTTRGTLVLRTARYVRRPSQDLSLRQQGRLQRRKLPTPPRQRCVDIIPGTLRRMASALREDFRPRMRKGVAN